MHHPWNKFNVGSGRHPFTGCSRRLALHWLLLLAAVALPLAAQEKVPASGTGRLAADVAARVDAAVTKEMERQDLVGVAVGLLQKGEVVYLQGYGLADREKNEPVTDETVFNWASNSKPLCGMAAMQLMEKGLLDLDADVRQYVPEFPKQKEGVITMRHLLSHTSGITHYGKVIPTRRAYPTKTPYLDPVLALDTFNRTALVSKPGEKELYSSYAYILASAVVQRVGKEPYPRQIEKRIAQPLGMTSLQLDMDHDRQPHWAAGYVKDAAGQVTRAKEEAHYWKHGAGGHKSNVKDFALWAQAVLNHRLIAAETETAMWTAQKTNDGTTAGYGLGFAIDGQNGLRVSHGGKQNEATSRLVIYPKQKNGIVVMTNCGFGDPGAITTAIFKALQTR
ncbi:serine hydrolase domain-containing protein [Prosthecobacter sp. SYSU 5D2]|uniref:serine hydrolase domain-containing protein n=1 Tax=Prosthecobacter sp. SYSU 5D2 TaxID=3134134 RepID=UPI0031FE8D15